jgi:Mrp family chromosome partitioning ATPase
VNVVWFSSPKGGTGVTTVAALTAIDASLTSPTVLVDLAGDAAAIVGVTASDHSGSADGWHGYHVTDRLTVIDVSGHSHPHQHRLVAHLATVDATVIVDAGHDTSPAAGVLVRHYSVLRACYLALRRACHDPTGPTASS